MVTRANIFHRRMNQHAPSLGQFALNSTTSSRANSWPGWKQRRTSLDILPAPMSYSFIGQALARLPSVDGWPLHISLAARLTHAVRARADLGFPFCNWLQSCYQESSRHAYS